MKNPFELIDDRLQNIEAMLIDMQSPSPEHTKPDLPLNMDKVCALTGKSKPSIYRYVSERIIPFHKQGGRLYFFKNEIIDWLKNQ